MFVPTSWEIFPNALSMAIQAHSSQENGFPDFERSAMLQPLMQTHSEFRLDILVDDPQDLGRLLDQAVQRLIPAALERRQGILVTQVFPDKYTVEVHQDVLCGVVQERRIDPNAHKSQLQTNSMT